MLVWFGSLSLTPPALPWLSASSSRDASGFGLAIGVPSGLGGGFPPPPPMNPRPPKSSSGQ